MDHASAQRTVVLTTSRGLRLKNPDARSVSATLASLPRDGHLVLELEGESGPESHYVQVWFRPDATYQLEYRDGSPDRHFSTRTVSQAKVVDALAGWMADGADDDAAWKAAFDWTNIGGMFA